MFGKRVDYHHNEAKTEQRVSENKKIDELSTHTSTNNIMEFKEVIYAGKRLLVCDKISVPQKNMNGNSKTGWEIQLET